MSRNRAKVQAYDVGSLKTMMPPSEFEYSIYIARNPDLAGLNPEMAAHHYESWGRDEGRICNAVNNRQSFLALIPKDASLLEIGPYTAPAFRRPEYEVRYLDAFTSEELRGKAAATGLDPGTVPSIDYVWHGEPYSDLITTKVASVFSSHNVEHQPDLIHHFQELDRILLPNGQLYFAIPDRRYCFDYYLPDTNFANVFGAYYESRRKHTAASVFEHRMLTTHNEAAQHWRGDHGPSPFAASVSPAMISIVHETLARIESTPGYIDTHAWQFTPTSFRTLIDILMQSGKVPFRVERVYPTIKNSNEFYAILTRV